MAKTISQLLSISMLLMAVNGAYASNRAEAGPVRHHDIDEFPRFSVESIGHFSGHAGVYYQDISKPDDDVSRDEFGNAYLQLKFETHEWYGLQLGVRGLFQGELADNGGAYDDIVDSKTALAELYGRYNYSATSLTLGRQELEWIMLCDFFEGVTLESCELDDFIFRFAWLNRMATLDPDDVTSWDLFNPNDDGGDTDGLYGAEISYCGFDSLELAMLYYRANGAYSFYGGRAAMTSTLDADLESTLLIEYYFTEENDNHGLTDGGNGSIFHINGILSFGDVSFGGGYIHSDEDVGAGSLTNNPWDPFVEDTHTDLADCQTWYVTAEYQFSDQLSLAAVYGESRTAEGDQSDVRYREFDIALMYQFSEDLSFEMGFMDLGTTSAVEQGNQRFWVNSVYKF